MTSLCSSWILFQFVEDQIWAKWWMIFKAHAWHYSAQNQSVTHEWGQCHGVSPNLQQLQTLSDSIMMANVGVHGTNQLVSICLQLSIVHLSPLSPVCVLWELTNKQMSHQVDLKEVDMCLIKPSLLIQREHLKSRNFWSPRGYQAVRQNISCNLSVADSEETPKGKDIISDNWGSQQTNMFPVMSYQWLQWLLHHIKSTDVFPMCLQYQLLPWLSCMCMYSVLMSFIKIYKAWQNLMKLLTNHIMVW